MDVSNRLRKELGPVHVFSIAAGAMISSGLFVLPAIAYQQVGSAIILSYTLAGIFVLPALLSKLELATALPKAGGTTFFSSLILGPGAGTVDGIANWLSISFKSAFAMIGIGSFAALLYPEITPTEIRLVAAAACLVFTAVNLLGSSHSGGLQVGMVLVLLVIIILFVMTGYRVVSVDAYRFSQPVEWNAVLGTAGMVFVSYGGLTKVASVAEEVRNPGKNLVIGMVAAYLVVQILYVLVVTVLVGVFPGDGLSSSRAPLSDAVLRMGSAAESGYLRVLFGLVTGAGLLAFITTGNAGILSASRNPLSMSREGLLPGVFGKLSARRRVPWVAVLVTSAFMLFAVFALDIEKMAKVASSFMLFLFIMVNLSVIIVRKSGLRNYQPTFRSPFFPYTQIVGILVYSYLVVRMGRVSLFIAVGVVIASIAWYLLYARNGSSRRSALVHMVERNAPPELQEGQYGLEDELLDILIERDEIIEDRFDHIIRDSLVLDYDHTVTRDQMFHDVAEGIAKRLHLNPIDLERKLGAREEESSTLIYPGVAVPHAIPHIIVEGTRVFDIVLVRNRFGIQWTDPSDVVYTAFCLVGSKDERTFHLRSLMAIAHVLQDPAFHRAWHHARSETELRTAVLLAKRKRLGTMDNR